MGRKIDVPPANQERSSRLVRQALYQHEVPQYGVLTRHPTRGPVVREVNRTIVCLLARPM